MTVFLTKVWGFDEPCGPLVFSALGWRANAERKLKPGDLVAVVGTLNDHPADDDIGALLGMMQPSLTRVSTLDYPIVRNKDTVDAAGNYRWPYGLKNEKAWTFDGKPEFKALVPRRFGTSAATGIEELTPEEASAVLAQPRREIALLTSATSDQREQGKGKVWRRGAPPPSEVIRWIMRMRDVPASTYLFRLSRFKLRPDDTLLGKSIVGYKVGWAFDPTLRMREFNKIGMPGLNGLEYSVVLTQRWETAREAFRMEQQLLTAFDAHRHPGNREILAAVNFTSLETAWNDYVKKRRLGC